MSKVSLTQGSKTNLNSVALKDGQILVAINGNLAEMYVDFKPNNDAQVVRRRIDKVLTSSEVISALGFTPMQSSDLSYATDSDIEGLFPELADDESE